MFTVPASVRTQFQTSLQHHAIPPRMQAAYHKWLRYYWDFCHKYHFPHDHKESLPHFLKKLQEKRQTQVQQEQAAHAIGLYYELLDAKTSLPTPDPRLDKLRTGSQADSGLTGKNTPLPPSRGESIPVPPGSAILFAGGTPALPGQSTPGPLRLCSGQAIQGGDSGAGEKTPAEPSEKIGSASPKARTGRGASWQAEYTRLAETLQGRQYAPKIARAYTRWVRKFQAFTRSQSPDSLSSEDARAFLVSLTTKRRMTVSKQNQVYDALLLFYRHALNKELEVVRPTRTPEFSPSPDTAEDTPSQSTPTPSQEGNTGKMPAFPGKPTPNPSQEGNVAASPRKAPLIKAKVPTEPHDTIGSGSQKAKIGKGASWEAEYAKLAGEIKTRHYSPSTFKTYRNWVRKFQAFTHSKPPELLSSEDVKAFLTFLAVERKMSASSQNQAFNALLFFFRHVLKKEFGKMAGVVRAKRKPYIPVVLSCAEIDAIFQHLEPPYDLVVKLLYGCGLRVT